MKDKLIELRSLVKPLQEVPENRIRYLAPESLDHGDHELLELSVLDIVVVLNPK